MCSTCKEKNDRRLARRKERLDGRALLEQAWKNDDEDAIEEHWRWHRIDSDYDEEWEYAPDTHAVWEMMDSLMELSIQDYEQYILNWLIDSQWVNLVNLNMTEKSVAQALITRTMNFEQQFSYSYSKIVGLQAEGPWVLKKDYIILEENKQNYEIPAGREINEVLWFSNQPITAFGMGGIGGFGGVGLGANEAGFAQMGYQGSYFMMSGFDYLIRMQEANILNRILGGSLTYRITALPDGKKDLQLYNAPGNQFNWGNYSQYVGRAVWYWYYDVTPDSRADCLKNNPDVIKMPNEVPLEEMTWTDLNVPAQQWVRRWFTAYVKETLGRVRGKYSGNLKAPDSELIMDYTSLLTEGKDEKTKLIEELTGPEGWLTRLRPEKVMEKEALLAENLNKQMKFRAMPRQIYVI